MGCTKDKDQVLHHTLPFQDTTPKSTNANSASAAINKWLKPRVPEGCVIHSFRHSLRDRLRAVQCPSDMIDQIGGWATAGVGQAYGLGYSLEKKWEWLILLEEKQVQEMTMKILGLAICFGIMMGAFLQIGFIYFSS